MGSIIKFFLLTYQRVATKTLISKRRGVSPSVRTHMHIKMPKNNNITTARPRDKPW